MRLLLAMADAHRREELRTALYARWEGWQIEGSAETAALKRLLLHNQWDLLVLQLGARQNRQLWNWLAGCGFPCPPRVLLLCTPEERSGLVFFSASSSSMSSCTPEERSGLVPDCTAPATATILQLCKLLEALAKKPLPQLALQMRKRLDCDIEAFLDALAMPRLLKGRSYAAWLLARLVPSPLGDGVPIGEWYRRCAGAFATTPAAVERCLRVAVECVFTQGDMAAIERCFGATVDPEKGKPTNRAFLLKAAAYLRYSFTDTRSLNSSEMHHSPAAPTSV